MQDAAENGVSPQIVLISVNPKAGARSGVDRVDALERELAARGFVVERETDIDVVSQRAHDYFAAGRLQAVVAAGGDGTVSLVLNRTPLGVPLAILSMGTENLLATQFRLKVKPKRLAELIASGHSTVLDVGQANGRLFLLMLGVGFDAQVVHEVDRRRTGHIYKWSYFKPIWHSIRKYRYPEMDVSIDGRQAIRACWAFVVNLPRYAGGLAIVPQADGRDGKLDVCTFRRGGFWPGFKYFAALLLRRHGRLMDCEIGQAKRISIEPVGDTDVPYQIDGDPGGVLPVEIEVIPGRMRLVVPAAQNVKR